MSRRKALKSWLAWTSMMAMALIGAFLLWPSQVDADPGLKMLVFVPSDDKPRDIEAALSSSLPGVDVTVFGKSKDLEQAVRQQNPDVVIAPALTLQELGLSVTVKGTRNGSTTEPYALVTIGNAVPPKALADKTVGVFGIMGRSGMKAMCGRLLGNDDQKITTVTKYADLLPLLQFQAAAAVILPKRHTDILTNRSALKLVVSDLPQGQVGLAAASVRPGSASSRIISSLKTMDGRGLAYLGVDGWQ